MTNNTPPYFLAIDNGTQSIRALVFDLQGNMIAHNKLEIEAYKAPLAGWAEQDAEYYWESLCEVVQGLWLKLDIPKEKITAVSVTTQRGTVVPMGSRQPTCRLRDNLARSTPCGDQSKFRDDRIIDHESRWGQGCGR